MLINNCCKDPLQELFLNAYETRKEGFTMGTLHTFPYPDPIGIPLSARIVRRINMPNCFGSFPIVPFIGIKRPAPAGVGDVSDYDKLPVSERIVLGSHPRNRLRRPIELPSRKDELHVLIGVGFYWWMKDEVSQEFFGYPIDPSIPTNRAPLPRPRVLRALYALRQLPVVDVCHNANALSLCWAIARKEVEPQRMEKMVNLFGHEVVLNLRERLREYRPSAKELGMLKSFLYKGHIRSLRFE